MIPKTFHQIWVGDKPIPDELLRQAATWRTHHPEWRTVLWAERPEEMPTGVWETVRGLPPIINQWLYENLARYIGARAVLAGRSDILRYEIIARFGGVYLDMDVECFEPIDELLEGVRLFVCDQYNAGCGNYMFGAVPNHPAMWSAVRELDAKRREADQRFAREDKTHGGHDLCPVLQFTGPSHLNPILRRHPDLVIFPYQLFNPLIPYADRSRVTRWPAAAMGNHNYYGSWYDRPLKDPPKEFTDG